MHSVILFVLSKKKAEKCLLLSKTNRWWKVINEIFSYQRHLGYTPPMFTQIPRNAAAKFNSLLFLHPPIHPTLTFLQQEVRQFRLSGAILMTGRERYQAGICISPYPFAFHT
jgi:hypothetical protein